jgi:hypothetical protein
MTKEQLLRYIDRLRFNFRICIFQIFLMGTFGVITEAEGISFFFFACGFFYLLLAYRYNKYLEISYNYLKGMSDDKTDV